MARLRRHLVIIALLSHCLGFHLRGEEGDPSLLTLDRIYNSEEFSGERFSARWIEDGRGYLTLESSEGPSGGRNLVLHDPETGEEEVLVSAEHLVPPGESSPMKIDSYEFSKDQSLLLIYTNSKRVWRRNTRGDYWVLDRSSRELRKLGGEDAKSSTLMFAKFSPTGRRVGYVREKNIYVEDLREGTITALTTTGSDRIINGTFDWVYEEEFGLRDGFRWSPDGKFVAYWQIDTEGVREFPLVNNTDSLYPKILKLKYPKVGEKNPGCRVGVVASSGGATRWLDVPGDPRDNYIAQMDWAGPREIILQHLNRLQNTNRVRLIDAERGTVRTVFTDRDEAWVKVFDKLNWLSGGESFTWVSERDGWSRVYLVSRSGDVKPVSAEGPDVTAFLAVDEKSGCVYSLASPKNPTQRYLYRSRLDGSETERITPSGQSGTHRYQISPGARWAIHSYSSFDTPSLTELVSLPDHKQVRVLADNSELREKIDKLGREPTEFFRVDIGEGALLDAWCIKPPDFDPGRKHPLLVYVYGEPAGQTVLDRWGGSGYLWHLMLAQRGYLVMSFDNRGTPAPRGRSWRKCVYRQVGVLAPADQAAALRKVIETRPYVDSSRVAIWGWSGGGSMSLNMIFKYPELYHTAMSIAPVPNQRYYDTIYQERYMGLPSDNVEGFRKGSPVNYAHQLEGNLLIVHGTGDDNCHYQGTEALINELIRHNKPFTMMAYPNRSHSIREGTNTTRHLRALLTRFLESKVPAGPREVTGP